MHRERTLRKPRIERRPQGLRFLFRSTVHQPIIGIPQAVELIC
jgi:hypothetical protein